MYLRSFRKLFTMYIMHNVHNTQSSKKVRTCKKTKLPLLALTALLLCSIFISGCDFATLGRVYDDKRMREPYDMEEGDYKVGDLMENPFIKTSDENISTFSIDVDTASYVNFRKSMEEMTLSKFQSNKYTVRTEEAINYFNYNYTRPQGDDIMAVNTLVGNCPWNPGSKLAMITLAGKELNVSEQAGSNIVFLIDVSGSMSPPNRLPLLKDSLKMAIENLNSKDIVSIVTYASGVKTVIAGVEATDKKKIIDALMGLKASGSTAGASGLGLAYSVASDYFIEGGNNRIILATDGDFNVGPSSIEELKQMVTEKRQSGIYLTVLGFGVDYLSGDERLEVLSGNGNGGYFVIDSITEGEKVLCEQFSGVMYTIAKDVKLQVEFNTNAVESYRLIGYENRMLANEDFDNDAVDAGDMGAGHTVTAFYELKLRESLNNAFAEIAQTSEDESSTDPMKTELFSVRIRYKMPDSDESNLYEHSAKISTQLGEDFYFAAAVAEACLVINNSKYKANASLSHALEAATEFGAGRNDIYKEEFISILQKLVNGKG